MTRVALWVRLEAKSGKESAVEEFLKSGAAIVRDEPATTAWFAVRLGNPACHFRRLPRRSRPQRPPLGKVAAALAWQKLLELLATPPTIEKIDVLADKASGIAFDPSQLLSQLSTFETLASDALGEVHFLPWKTANRQMLPNILSLRSGTIGRAPYFVAGVCLLAIKFGVDRIISRVFERPWSPAEYIVPGASLGMLIANPQDRLFYTTLAIGAVPFIAMGVWLTVLRLRSIGVSPAWSILFFAPVINFALFAILTALPERIRKGNVVSGGSIPPASEVPHAIPLSYSQIPARPFASLDRLLPANPPALKAVAVLVPAFIGLAVTVLSVQFLSTYGWGVFVGVPFCIGLMAAILFAVRGAPSLSSCIGIGCASLTVYGVLLILCAFEGAVCILMAAPLAYPVAILGALVGASLTGRPDRAGDARQVMSATLLFLPIFVGAEKLAAPEAQTFVITSSIDVDAPPEKVWANVIGFTAMIPSPTELVFRSGVAYPHLARNCGLGPCCHRPMCLPPELLSRTHHRLERATTPQIRRNVKPAAPS